MNVRSRFNPIDLLAKKFRWRRDAYQAVFEPENELQKEWADAVLADLSNFCGMRKPSIRADNTGRVDPIATAFAEGRRDVFLRILSHMKITDDQLYELAERYAREMQVND